MPIICFIRTTHENGQFRSFPPEAHPFWREQGVIVGVVLRPECALTLLNLRPRARSKPCNRFLQRLFYHQTKPGWPGVWGLVAVAMIGWGQSRPRAPSLTGGLAT